MTKFFARLLDKPKGQINKTAELYIYDEIEEFWGIGPSEVINRLAEMDLVEGDVLNVYINSPGGVTTDGMAIFTAISRVKAKVITHNDGLAASMGSIIFMAGDERKAAEGSFLMIHNPWTLTVGEAEDLRKDADLLDKMKNALLSIYTNRVETSSEEISNMMDEETWMTSEEAVAFGFATAEEKRSEEKNLVSRELWDGAKFDRIPTKAAAFFKGSKKTSKKVARKEEPQINFNNNEGRSDATDGKKATQLEGDYSMDAKAYREKHPEQYDLILTEGAENTVKNERERIQSIENLAQNFSNSSPAVKAAVQKAIDEKKYEDGVTAEKMAISLLEIANKQASEFVEKTASGKRAEADVAADIPEGEEGEDGSGDSDGEEKENKARVSGMVKGMQNNKKEVSYVR